MYKPVVYRDLPEIRVDAFLAALKSQIMETQSVVLVVCSERDDAIIHTCFPERDADQTEAICKALNAL